MTVPNDHVVLRSLDPLCRPMETAPKDETWVLLRTPWSESGWTIAFWASDQPDGWDGWYASEADSKPVTAFGDEPTGWVPL